MVFKWYFDKNLENKEEVERKFKEVVEVYEVLLNDKKRDIYDKYGKEGLNGRVRSYFDDFFEYGFIFRKLDDVFKEIFGERDLFLFYFFEDLFEDFLNGLRSCYGSRNRGGRCVFFFFSEYLIFERFFLCDIGYILYGLLGYEGFNLFFFLVFDDSGMGNYVFVIILGKIVNGRNINIKRIIEND